jgi:hypothetical protein
VPSGVPRRDRGAARAGRSGSTYGPFRPSLRGQEHLDDEHPHPDATLERDRATARWRTVDIVVASVIGVAFGVVFWGWASLWNVLAPAFAGFPPAQAVIYGMWLVPASSAR